MSGPIAADQSASELPVTTAGRLSPRGPATIYDIARLAGVNPSTVSRALSKPGRTSAATEARIRAAAAQLNFRINPIARALHSGRTRTLALIVADITNPVVFGLVRGAEEAASARDYSLVIAESQESAEAEAGTIDRILPGVDGLILATTRLPSQRIIELGTRTPVVLINRAVEGVPAVLPDVERGVSQLLDHLGALGHSSIAFLSGPADSWINARRSEHLMGAAVRAELELIEIGPNSPTITGGRATLRQVLAAGPTAVVAFNDLMAIGLMQATASEGVRVPGDLSVVGFDDIFASDLITPPLTTIRAQGVSAGQRAVDHLLERLEGVEMERAPTGLLETALVIRESTGPARPGQLDRAGRHGNGLICRCASSAERVAEVTEQPGVHPVPLLSNGLGP